MYRHLFLVLIEAQNKSCKLGETTASAVFVLIGRYSNLESELYVFSQATKNFLNS